MRARGFTVIELVTVIVIVGALAVFLLPRLDPSGFDAYGFRQQVLSAARYAQKTAMASGCPVQLQASAAADSVSLFLRSGGDDASCGGGAFSDPLQNPAQGGAFAVSAPEGTDVTSGATIVYDGFGRSDNSVDTTIAIDPGSDIVIEARTGYAHDA